MRKIRLQRAEVDETNSLPTVHDTVKLMWSTLNMVQIAIQKKYNDDIFNQIRSYFVIMIHLMKVRVDFFSISDNRLIRTSLKTKKYKFQVLKKSRIFGRNYL